MKQQSKNGLTYGRGYVYSRQYHIIFCTKYRKPVLCDEIADDCKHMFRQIAEIYNFTIAACEVMSDYVHLLVDCKPQFIITDMVKIVKGNIARWLFTKHKNLKQQLWGGHLWNPSYCITTVNNRTAQCGAVGSGKHMTKVV